jgi:hypothetical protein
MHSDCARDWKRRRHGAIHAILEKTRKKMAEITVAGREW